MVAEEGGLEEEIGLGSREGGSKRGMKTLVTQYTKDDRPKQSNGPSIRTKCRSGRAETTKLSGTFFRFFLGAS